MLLTFGNEVLLVGVNPFDSLEVGLPVARDSERRSADSQVFLLEKHATKHATLLADALGEGAGIDTVHGRDALLLEPCSKGRGGEEVREVFTSIRSGNETGNVNLVGLKVGGEILEKIIDGFPRGDAIVSNKREGNDENLTAVRRIGHGLRVADHAGLEDKLAGNALGRTKAVALVGRAILKLKANKAFARRIGDGGRGGAVDGRSHDGNR